MRYVQILIFGSNDDLHWVQLEQLRKPVKQNAIPLIGQRAEAAEDLECGHCLWYCGTMSSLGFVLDSVVAEGAISNLANIDIPQPTNTTFVRGWTEPEHLTVEEAMALVSCSSSPSKLFPAFSSLAEPASLPDELLALAYADDKEELWKCTSGLDFNLGAFADMLSLREATELSTMAESFGTVYAAMVPPPAPSWPESQEDNHRHLAHVRCVPCATRA